MSTEEAAEAVGVPVAVLMQAARWGRVRFSRRRSGRSGLWDTGRLQFLLRDVQEWFEEFKPECHGITQKRILGSPCINCKRTIQIYAKLLCHACYKYQRTTGSSRPVPKTAEEIAAELAALPPRPCHSKDRTYTDENGVEWLPQAEAAEVLNVSRERVRQLVQMGRFTSMRFGNDKAARIMMAEAEAWVKNKSTPRT